MRVTLNIAKCESFASCVVAAPEVFDLDEEENVAVLLDESPPEEMRSAVEEAVRSCPVQAIALSD
ncbi:ferredoxin [Haloechinothrix salitolerans]|uniref:Ferredoxin n=1 Tax=Haloechinothrix salitolerans TaxID=926830 RepID=A0ABW2C6L9_9PSEU